MSKIYIDRTYCIKTYRSKILVLDCDNIRKAFPDLSLMSDDQILFHIRSNNGCINALNPADGLDYSSFDDLLDECEVQEYENKEAEESFETQVFSNPSEWNDELWTKSYDPYVLDCPSENGPDKINFLEDLKVSEIEEY